MGGREREEALEGLHGLGSLGRTPDEVARDLESLFVWRGELSLSEKRKAVELVVRALKSHPSDATVQMRASGVLAELCDDSQERAAKAAELGGLEALVRALESHPSHANVQMVASSALAHLCKDSQERAAKAAELGGLEALVRALESHPSDANVQKRASRALAELCDDSQERAAKAAELGGLEALVRALESHPDAHVQMLASRALAELCKDSQERAAEAAKLGALELLEEELRRRPYNDNASLRRILRAASQESPTDHEVGGARPSLPAPTPERRTEAPVAQDDFGSKAESEAEERLKAAMKGRDANQLNDAIQAAKAAKVRAEVLVEAHEALLRLHKDSTKSATSAMASLRLALNMDRSDIPAGIQICQALDKVYQCFQTPEVASGDEFLKACCQERGLLGFTAARQPAAHTRLKQSVFGLLEPEEIKERACC